MRIHYFIHFLLIMRIRYFADYFLLIIILRIHYFIHCFLIMGIHYFIIPFLIPKIHYFIILVNLQLIFIIKGFSPNHHFIIKYFPIIILKKVIRPILNSHFSFIKLIIHCPRYLKMNFNLIITTILIIRYFINFIHSIRINLVTNIVIHFPTEFHYFIIIIALPRVQYSIIIILLIN